MNPQGAHSVANRAAIAAVAIGWALFQLALARILILDSIVVRAIHLAFAIVLIYLSIPKIVLPLKIALALLAAAAVLYVVIDWQGISTRSGRPISRDIVISIGMIVLLLIAARRSIGFAMPIIVIGFTLYAFLGPYLPGFLGYRGISLNKFVNQLVLSDEGTYGIPLDVSASTVYLFVLLGAMLGVSGAGRFFNDSAIALLGRFKGGPAKAAVVSSGLAGMASGSSIANVVTTGTFTIPLMKKVGYPGTVAAATEVAASTNGQLMPPIMGAAAFIIAEYLAIGYVDVIRAAAIPAFVSYIALFYITHLEATRLGMRGLEAVDIPRFGQVLRNGWHHLIPLGLLFFSLFVLRRTPKLAAFNAIIVLVLKDILIQLWRKVSLVERLRAIVSMLGRGLIEGSMNMLPVALATATAGMVVGIVNTGIGSLIVQVVEVLSAGNIFILLSITAVASLLLGMGLPTTATYIVMASITVPIITMLGGAAGLVIPAIAAHLFCFYFGILADDTPPVGLAAYTAAAIADSKPFPTGVQGFLYDLRTAIIPFMFVLNPELLLIGSRGLLQGLLIFLTAALGACAFANAVQGWALIKNRWFERLLFLPAALIFFLPGRTAALLGIAEHLRYLTFLIALAIYGGLFLLQRQRMRAVA